MSTARGGGSEERKGISRRYNTVIDWAKFGPPPERGGLAFLEEHYDVYSDDAKQNNYHTKSVLDATIASFLQQRPWLAGNRSSYMQSDNASNYRDPTTEVDLLSVGTRCFSEAGMGKDEGDGNGAVIKGKIRRVRDESNGIEHAEDLLQIGHNMGIKWADTRCAEHRSFTRRWRLRWPRFSVPYVLPLDDRRNAHHFLGIAGRGSVEDVHEGGWQGCGIWSWRENGAG